MSEPIPTPTIEDCDWAMKAIDRELAAHDGNIQIRKWPQADEDAWRVEMEARRERFKAMRTAMVWWTE